MAPPESSSELSAEEADFHASKIVPSWELAEAATERADASAREANGSVGNRGPDTIIEPVDAVSADEVQISDEEAGPDGVAPLTAQAVIDVGSEPVVAKSDPPLAATKPSVSKPPAAKSGRAGKTRMGMGTDVETPPSPLVEPPAVSKTRPDTAEAPKAGAPRKAPGGTLVMEGTAAAKPARNTPITRSDEVESSARPASKSFGGADEDVVLPVGESKGLGMKIGIGLVAVLAIGLGIKFLAGSSSDSVAPPAPVPTTPAKTAEAAPAPPPVTQAAAAPAPAPTPTPEPVASAAPAETAAATAAPVETAKPAPEPPPVKRIDKGEKHPVAEKKAGGNKAAPAGKAGSGVIIKETPF